jgi:hypothetical protein
VHRLVFDCVAQTIDCLVGLEDSNSEMTRDVPDYWRWKSRSFGGRPQIDAELRALIRRMSVENLLWGPTFLIGPAWGACAVKQNGVMAVRGRALGSGGARGSGSGQPRSKHSNAAKVISAAAAYVWFLPERREVP